VTDTNNDDFPNLCTTCEPGRGPPLLTNSGGQPTNANVACTRKYFSGAEGIKIPTFTCYNTDIDKHATFEAGCHYEWPGSSYADDWCHNDGDCTVAEDHILCNVPQYWAYPNFDHAAWGECSASHGEHGASQFRSRYGGMPASPQ